MLMSVENINMEDVPISSIHNIIIHQHHQMPIDLQIDGMNLIERSMSRLSNLMVQNEDWIHHE
jgi:hypothetical protein